MTVAITCAGCRRTLRVPEDQIGQTVRCPLCIETFFAVADLKQPPPPARKQEPRQRVVVADLAEDAPEDALVAALEPEPDAATAPQVEEPRRPTKPFKTVTFGILFLRDPDRLLRGRVDAELTLDGLRVRLRSRHALYVPVLGPNPVRYLGGNRLSVFLDGREVTVALVKARTDLNRLAQDSAAFLNGRRAEINGRAYTLPWRLTLLPWLALAVPFLAIWLRVLGGVHGGGRFLWFLSAGVAVLCGIKYMRRESLSTGRRAAVALSAVGCCLLLLASAFAYRLVNPTTVRSDLWRPFSAAGQRCRLIMPGVPVQSIQMVAGVQNSVVHSVTVSEVEKTFSLTIGSMDARVIWGNGRDAVDGYRRQLEQEIHGYSSGRAETVVSKSGEIGVQVEMTLAGYNSRGHRGTQISRLFLSGNELFTLSVIGEDLDADDPDVKKFFGSFQLGAEATPPSPTSLPGLVAYWSFEDLGHNQPAEGSQYFNVASGPGVRGNAAVLGLGGFVGFDSHPNLNFAVNQPFSFVTWVKTSPNQNGCIFTMNGGRQDRSRLELFLDNNKLFAFVSPAGFEQAGVLESREQWPNDNRWHHVALTRGEAGKITLYLDGNLTDVKQDSRYAGAFTTTVRSFGCRRFGQWDVVAHLTGALDEAAFFNRCLSPDEIARLFHRE